MHVPVTCKYKKDQIKTTEKRWRHCFSHYKSMGAFCCHGNQSFDPICPKILCSLSPTQVMLHIKFDQDWPTGFRDIQVWKCGRQWRATMDGRRTIGILEAHLVSLWLRWANNMEEYFYSASTTLSCFGRGKQTDGHWWRQRTDYNNNPFLVKKYRKYFLTELQIKQRNSLTKAALLSHCI